MYYIVQRKAEKFIPLLLNSYKNKNYDETRRLIDQLLETLQYRCLKGIRNTDQSGYLRNIAWMDKKVVEIGLGGYRRLEKPLNREEFKKEFMIFSNKFQKWASKKIPLLDQYVEIKAKIMLDETLLKL